MVGGLFGKKDDGKAEQSAPEKWDGKGGLVYAKDPYTADALLRHDVWNMTWGSEDEHGRVSYRNTMAGKTLRFFLHDGLWYCIDNGTSQKPPRSQILVEQHPAYLEEDATAFNARLADATAKLKAVQTNGAIRFARIADDLPAFVQARRDVIAALAGETHAELIARQFDEMAGLVTRAVDELRATVEEAGAAVAALEGASDRA